jgi:hypothetical protein
VSLGRISTAIGWPTIADGWAGQMSTKCTWSQGPKRDEFFPKIVAAAAVVVVVVVVVAVGYYDDVFVFVGGFTKSKEVL